MSMLTIGRTWLQGLSMTKCYVIYDLQTVFRSQCTGINISTALFWVTEQRLVAA